MIAGVALMVALTAAVTVGVVAWSRLEPDLQEAKPNVQGMRGRAAAWLEREAPVDVLPGWDRGGMPDRRGGAVAWLVAAWVQRESARRGEGPEAVLAALRATAPDVARALLEGKVSRAARLHARRRYRGRRGLFPLWYAFVALPRHGRRGLLLQAVVETLEEMEP